MPAETLRADTVAIRTLGDALNAHSADLGAVAAALRSIPSAAAGLGPIGERFAAALADAVSAHSDAAAALGVRIETGAVTAGNTAAGYDTAGQRAAQLLPQV
ncbi:hypothetical protein [Mycolicibacterium neworleansense]|uniref:ESX-1 secretion-associated protein n=1 Tax=Mycolicibacterium neworleansense TaxID=146018 RepID=A0A0H5S3R7_9MYCO|nr:hypothetical protein [Mycolicibacterium neworleansense]MCV7364966.1 hypothetical protein [Mycolicibacterium neworleansense]CRZ15769.1 hypothetical protein BN2156_02632 [Mycolicibacterium neworleansense]